VPRGAEVSIAQDEIKFLSYSINHVTILMKTTDA
jgi:hypothetical protein